MLSMTYSHALVLGENNTVSLRNEYRSNTVSTVIHKLQKIHTNLPEGAEINLYLDSPGGSIIAGEELIKFVNSLNRPVNVICNFCASMAFQTLQGINGKRLVTNMGILMSHKAYGGFDGEFPGQLENRLNFWLKRLNKVDEAVVKRTNGKQTLETYKELYENEYWCTDTDCINDGFADAVVDVTCDKTLNGIETQIVQGFFGNFEVHLSKCPIITGVIKYRSLDSDGDPIGPFITNSEDDLMDLLLKGKSIQGINRINLNDVR